MNAIKIIKEKVLSFLNPILRFLAPVLRLMEKWGSFALEATLGFTILFGFPYYTFKNNSWDALKTHSWMFIFLAVWAVGWLFYLRWLYLTLGKKINE